MTESFDSPIRAFAIDADDQGGLDFHSQLRTPTPEDDRWAGYCLLKLGQAWHARDLLARALNRGCQAAAIELSMVYQTLGEPKIAQHFLAQLNLEPLSPFDLAQAKRAQSHVHSGMGFLKDALQALEQAWQIANQIEECKPIRAEIADQLGQLHTQIGTLDQARYHFAYALEHTAATKQARPMVSRAYAHSNAGRYKEAEQDLIEAKTHLPDSPNMATIFTYQLGLLRQMQRRWPEALALQLETASLAKSRGEREIEFFAELSLIAMHTALGRIDQARGHLGRANHILNSPREQAYLAMRDGRLLAAREQPQALERLEQALAGFQALGLHREIAWANLHLSETHLKNGDLQAAHEALEHAASERYALGPGTGVVQELHFLPLTFDRLSDLPSDAYSSILMHDWRSLEGATAARIHLQTLGAARVIVDGRPAKLTLRRTIEVITFLLLNPHASREKIFATLWTDEAPQTAANYLHQARLELARTIPGFQIAFNKSEKTYSVQCEGPKLTWDLLEVQHLLTSDQDDALERVLTYLHGPFLPLVDNPWVLQERSTLEQSVMTQAFKNMGRWQTQGELKRCQNLARRLLEIEPLNPKLIQTLIEGLLILDGPAVARHELAQVIDIFQKEFEEFPSELLALGRKLNLLPDTTQ